MRKHSVYTVLIILLLATFNLDAQVRKPERTTQKKAKFEFVAGVHRVHIPGTRSYYTITIKGKKPKIKSITRTEGRRTLKLKPTTKPSTCAWDCPCGIECWEDPILRQSICACKPCGNGGGGFGGDTAGSIAYIGPCDAS